MSEAIMTMPGTTTPNVVLGWGHCPHCNHLNPPGGQFCAACGTRLWEPCIACGTMAALQEKYCGSCGTDLAAALERRNAELELELRRCEALRGDYHFQDATAALARLAAIKDHRLEQFRGRAVALITEIEAQRIAGEQQKAHALHAALELLEHHRELNKAAGLLEELPDWLRDEAVQNLLHAVREQQAEVNSLVSDIRRAMAEKQWEGLLPKVERLLELQPNHDTAPRLAEKLRKHEQQQQLAKRQRLHEAAKAKLEDREYANAAKLLSQIPEAVRTPELAALLEETQGQADDVAWLRGALQQAVENDEHLFGIANRLLQLTPGDTVVEKVVAELFKLQSQPNKGRGAVLSWVKDDGRMARGFALDHFPGYQRVAGINDGTSAALAADPGAFCVAMGLALQGIGKGPAQANLLPQKGTRFFDRITQAISKRAAKTAWGIDVGRRAIKAVRLSCESGDQVTVEAAEFIEHETILNAPDVNVNEVLGASIKTLLERQEIGRAPVCVNVPSSAVFARFLVLPVMDSKKLDRAMRYEVQQQIPVPIEEVTWDYQVLSKQADPDGVLEQQEIALWALKTDHAKRCLDPLTERDLKVELMQSDSAALFNYLSLDHCVPDDESTAAGRKKSPSMLAMLDLGTEVANLLVTNGSSLWTRTLSCGGNQFTRAISRELSISFSEAEKLKRQPLQAPRISGLYRAMQPVFDDLRLEVQRSLDYYAGLEGRRMFKRLIVVGGTPQLHGLFARLRRG